MKTILNTLAASLLFSTILSQTTGNFNTVEQGLKTPDKVINLYLDNDTNLIDSIVKFKNLNSISLNNFDQQLAPKIIGELTWLKKIEITNSNFKKIPKEYRKLINLDELILINDTSLDISNTLTTFLTASKLKKLDIEGFNFYSIPSQVYEFKSLESLILREDNIKDIPLNIKTLKNIKTLNLGGNNIENIPSSLSELEKLEVLFFDNEKKLNFNSSFKVLEDIPNLKELHLEGNQINNNDIRKLDIVKLERLYLDATKKDNKIELNLNRVEHQNLDIKHKGIRINR